MHTSAGGLADSSSYIWYSDDPLGVVSRQGDCLVPLPFAIDEEGDQVGDDGRAEAGDRVPAGFGVVSGDAQQTVAAGGDVVEGAAVGVALGDVIQGLVDRSQATAGSLVGQGDDARPLRRAGTRSGRKCAASHMYGQEGSSGVRVVSDVGHAPCLVVVLLQWGLEARTAEE